MKKAMMNKTNLSGSKINRLETELIEENTNIGATDRWFGASAKA